MLSARISSEINGLSITGDFCHYATRGGARIEHPRAYAKRGWSNMIYCHSTRRKIYGSDTPQFAEALRSIILGLRRAAQDKLCC